MADDPNAEYYAHELALQAAWASPNFNQMIYAETARYDAEVAAQQATTAAAPYADAQLNAIVAATRADLIGLNYSAQQALTVEDAISAGTYKTTVENLQTEFIPIWPNDLGYTSRIGDADAKVREAIAAGDVAAYHLALDAANEERRLQKMPNIGGDLLVSDLSVLTRAPGALGILAGQVIQGYPLYVPEGTAAASPNTTGAAAGLGYINVAVAQAAQQTAFNSTLLATGGNVAIATAAGAQAYAAAIAKTPTAGTQTVVTATIPQGTQSSVPATTAPPLSAPVDTRPTTGTVPAGANSAGLTTSQGPAAAGSLAAQIQSAGGGPNALLGPDEWGWYFGQITGTPAPPPEDMGFSAENGNRSTPMKFAAWWDAALKWAAGQGTSSPANSAAGKVMQTVGGGPGPAPGPPAPASKTLVFLAAAGLVYLLFSKGRI
jgi:hypothetical protein